MAARPGERPPDAGAIRAARLALIGDTTLTGEALASALAHQADSWFAALGEVLPRGWALMAVGGYARGALCPGSDLDVVLLHPTRARAGEVKGVAEHVWYPFWDAGLKLSPAAHSPKSLLQLARGDLVTATSILGVRPLAGDHAVVHAVGVDARVQWRKRPLHWLRLLLAECEERWARAGEVSSLLEPNLKDGRGGLRDRDVLHWAVATGRDDVIAALEAPLDELEGPAGVLYAVRCELHRVTGRPGNVFMLQEQDAVARAMRVPNARGDADVLMRRVSAAARAIDWAGGRFWRRVDRVQSGRTVTRRQHALPEPIPGAALVDDELDIVDEAAAGSPRDESFPLRIAGAASRLGVPLSRRALAVLADQVHADRRGPTTPWPERTRRAFVGLLGSGPAMVTTVESLEHYGVFSHYLPEWKHVRSLPQRNAFHLYNVDRHLLRAVANANELVRTVGRPDLLLVGALMHDIGKGYPSDHTDVGMEIVDTVLPRMGFGRQDTAVVRAMVEHHLLLAETATRRDLSDPRTAANVAAAVGDLERLHLLRALTEADSLATGPSAWSPWKQHLVDQLVGVVALDLRGRALPTGDVDGEQRFAGLLAHVRRTGAVAMEHEQTGEFEVLSVAAPDHIGLFAQVAGTLALHRVDVTGAEAWTSADAVAVLQFQILSDGEAPPYTRIRRDLPEVLAGRLDVEARLSGRIDSFRRAYRRATAAAAPSTSVTVSNNESDATTMIDVRLPDGPAVLFRLAAVLSAHGVSIRTAKVQTLGHEVVDVFYVDHREPARVPRQLLRSEGDELRGLLLAAAAPPPAG